MGESKVDRSSRRRARRLRRKRLTDRGQLLRVWKWVWALLCWWRLTRPVVIDWIWLSETVLILCSRRYLRPTWLSTTIPMQRKPDLENSVGEAVDMRTRSEEIGRKVAVLQQKVFETL
jgi:hypothetical protein